MNPIQRYFDENPLNRPSGKCLDEAELFAWTHGTAAPAALERCLNHAASCEVCTEKAALLKELADAPPADKEPPASLSKRAASRIAKKPPLDRRSYAWFGLFAVFMVLSFTWKRYFAQMLVLAVVCAVKWLLETRARRVFVDITHRGDGPRDGSRGGSQTRSDAASGPLPGGISDED